MSELGEPVGIGMIDEVEGECPFNHDKPGKAKNDLGNSSGKLGTRLTNGWSTQLWTDSGKKIEPKENQALVTPCPDSDCPPSPAHLPIDDKKEPFPYSISAHHLIPGDAALPKSNLKEYVSKGAKIRDDIGYDINGADNGVWLPTHAALAAAMKAGKLLHGMVFSIKYAALSEQVERNDEENPLVATFQQRYAYAVMEQTSRQFHDSHPDYSDHVIKVLNKIHLSLLNFANYSCPKCKEARGKDGKLPPPHRLVFRLNAVSRRLKGFLVGNPLGWRPPLFTSRFAQQLAGDARIWRARGI